jgi:hypothetical protein
VSQVDDPWNKTCQHPEISGKNLACHRSRQSDGPAKPTVTVSAELLWPKLHSAKLIDKKLDVSLSSAWMAGAGCYRRGSLKRPRGKRKTFLFFYLFLSLVWASVYICVYFMKKEDSMFDWLFMLTWRRSIWPDWRALNHLNPTPISKKFCLGPV